ncbi:MAG: Stealth CR1 domain-containing protein [Bacilli bacterium]|nr:Stealth CR1 domain-containing protein [Bacilli bacterium]
MSGSYDERKLKQYEQKILDKFVEICEAHDLNYYLAYGTLLGAIRHKGFIPWDDDIDVYMKPEDYYKFKDIMIENSVNGYFYQSLETEKYYSLLFAKLRMNNTSVIEEKLKDEKIHNGIYIDIFPLVPFPKNEVDQKKLFRNIKIINLLIEADLKNKIKYNNYGKIGKIVSKIFKFIPRSIRNNVAKRKLKNILFYDEEYNEYICLFDNKRFSKSYFDEDTNVLFENKEYKSPKEYHDYLTDIYEDYMTPPPESDRRGHAFISVDFKCDFNDKIDFVICWVDGNDKEWQKEKSEYDPNKKKKDGVNGTVRYRDWDNLQYWFRGVEKYAPWVNKIYFVTWGHLPEWLNIDNPKLVIVNHKDYIPKKYLPVFSSHPIEFNFHLIKGLSEKFVIFNDDMFIINKVRVEDFFKKNLPRDTYNEVNWNSSDEDPVFASILKNNYDILSKHYNKRKVILSRPFKYMNIKYGLKRNLRTLKSTLKKNSFIGIGNNHLPQPFLKEYFYKLWEKEYENMDKTCSHKFRNKEDINQYLIRYFQIMDGKFVPRDYKLGKYFGVGNDNSELISYIKEQKGKCVCINDSNSSVDFEKCKLEINDAFDEILSEKSSYEK